MTTEVLEVHYLAPDDLSVGLDFRLDDDPEALSELARSVAEHGVLQPLLVRPSGDGWEVVAGRRRLAAARIAEASVVPCIVRSLDDDAAADAALAENLHRRDLSPLEQAMAYARLKSRGLQQQEIAKRVGKSPQHLSTILALLDLPQDLQRKVHLRQMSPRTALERVGRRLPLKSGSSTHGTLDGDTAAIVSHWRRRHDRLMAGIAQVITKIGEGHDAKQMLLRLVTLDRQPLSDREA